MISQKGCSSIIFGARRFASRPSFFLPPSLSFSSAVRQFPTVLPEGVTQCFRTKINFSSSFFSRPGEEALSNARRAIHRVVKIPPKTTRLPLRNTNEFHLSSRSSAAETRLEIYSFRDLSTIPREGRKISLVSYNGS